MEFDFALNFVKAEQPNTPILLVGRMGWGVFIETLSNLKTKSMLFAYLVLQNQQMNTKSLLILETENEMTYITEERL